VAYALQKIQIRTLEIKIELIKELQFDCQIDRKIRRDIVRKNNMKWKIYKILKNEIQRRIKYDLNLETGKPNDKNN
jgi:hypothetical protein